MCRELPALAPGFFIKANGIIILRAGETEVGMPSLLNFAAKRPILFGVAVFLAESLLALPFVAGFRLLGQDLVALRLIIPAAQSALMLWIIWSLGWFGRCGFTSDIRDGHLLWYPALGAFIPMLLYGTVPIPPGPVTFYFLALVFTGISEEALCRGLLLPLFLSRGRWFAVFAAAALFSSGHLSNIFVEDFSLLEWTDKFLETFGFGVLYGAVFLRTGNIWPLIFLHMLADVSYLTSGTAGPYLAEPMHKGIHLALSLSYIAYGVLILRPGIWTTRAPARP